MRTASLAALICIATVASFSLFACQTTQQAPETTVELSQTVKKGMTPEQVRAALGEPVRVEERDGDVKWMIYGTGANRSLIYFQNGKVKNVP